MSSAPSDRCEPPYLVLVNSDASITFDLLRKKTISVTRAGFNGDLEIHGDPTVSRSHAEISCIKKTINGEVKMFMQVLDKKSKFGTFVNEGIASNKRIESDHPIILSHGDSIRFGLTDCGSFQLLVRAFNVSMSSLKKQDKIILKKVLNNIKGINIQQDIDEQTTHLCMNAITITEKALISLAVLRPIVTVQYFTDLYKALLPNSSKELPFTADYLPPLSETLLNPNSVSLDITPERKGLFSEKTFFCSSEGQINRVAKIIKAAGGNVLLHVDCQNMSINTILNDNKFIFMQQDPSYVDTDGKYLRMLDLLQNMDKRPIPESEIGLAIIFASTKKYCNPLYNMSLTNPSQSNATQTQARAVLAQDTEEVKIVENSQMFSVTCVPDSLGQTNSSFKRPLEVIMDSDDIMMPNKRTALLDEENIENFMDVDVENREPIKSFAGPKKTAVIDFTINSDSCVTHVPSSQDISKENNLSNSLQVSVTDKNKYNTETQNNSNNLYSNNVENITNNLHSTTIENSVISNKRKLSNVCSLSNNDDSDLFDYMNVDEIEELPTKKPKNQYTESIFQPLPATTSNKNNEQPTFEEPKSILAVDPLNIMNLLADVKGTGQFIDSSKLPDKSTINLNEDPEYSYLSNSVIVETVNMVKSRPLQTLNSFQDSHSDLKNFKKFIKKGPAMRIPHIVPLDVSYID